LSYDPENGSLVWNELSEKFFGGDLKACLTWNKRNAGRLALESVCKRGYKRGMVLGVAFHAHRICWAIHYGKFPSDGIDHISGEKADNRISNLRDVGQTENTKNKSIPKQNSSGIIGVSWSKKYGKWIAQIGHEGRKLHLRRHERKEDAVKARKEAERRLGFHPNHGRAA
jgi:hypothetical protein